MTSELAAGDDGEAGEGGINMIVSCHLVRVNKMRGGSHWMPLQSEQMKVLKLRQM